MLCILTYFDNSFYTYLITFLEFSRIIVHVFRYGNSVYHNTYIYIYMLSIFTYIRAIWALWAPCPQWALWAPHVPNGPHGPHLTETKDAVPPSGQK